MFGIVLCVSCIHCIDKLLVAFSVNPANILLLAVLICYFITSIVQLMPLIGQCWLFGSPNLWLVSSDMDLIVGVFFNCGQFWVLFTFGLSFVESDESSCDQALISNYSTDQSIDY